MQLPLLFLVLSSLALVQSATIPLTQETGSHDWVPQDIQKVPSQRVPRSPQEKDNSKGTVDVGVHREKGVGTVVQAKGEGNIWESKDGNTRVDAQGEWSKVINGPGRAKPQYSGGIRFTHRF